MPANVYHFIDRWRVEGDVTEVADILEDVLSLPRWWGSVYFDVQELEPGDAHELGRLIRLHAGGWLHTLCASTFARSNRVIRTGFPWMRPATSKALGFWTFEPDGQFVKVNYKWTIRANKRIIETLSFLLKPIFRFESQLDHESW